MGFQGAFETHRDRCQGSLMEDEFDALHGSVRGGFIGGVAFDQLHLLLDMPQVVTEAGAQVIEHAYLMACFDQSRGNMGTDKAGAAGYETSRHENSASGATKGFTPPQRRSS
jgi:hypothetical protein